MARFGLEGSRLTEVRNFSVVITSFEDIGIGFKARVVDLRDRLIEIDEDVINFQDCFIEFDKDIIDFDEDAIDFEELAEGFSLDWISFVLVHKRSHRYHLISCISRTRLERREDAREGSRWIGDTVREGC